MVIKFIAGALALSLVATSAWAGTAPAVKLNTAAPVKSEGANDHRSSTGAVSAEGAHDLHATTGSVSAEGAHDLHASTGASQAAAGH